MLNKPKMMLNAGDFFSGEEKASPWTKNEKSDLIGPCHSGDQKRPDEDDEVEEDDKYDDDDDNDNEL